MVEAVMLWNEPNNLSNWNFEVDRQWETFGRMVRLAGQAVHGFPRWEFPRTA
jgi:hypothetical protein